MCIQINGEDFVTIHHELGHNIYQRAYRTLPFVYRDSANDGFHEAIGDAVALSVTPDYLVKVGLLGQAPGAEGDLEFLMRMALDKVAFLPFGLLVDQWRWQVFSGAVTPDRYNSAWWELRRKYQNVAEPVARSEQDFDPGAKYHVPANTPVLAVFPRPHPSVPVSPRDVPRGRLHRACSTAARCTATSRWAPGWRRCSRWDRASRGPMPSRR